MFRTLVSRTVPRSAMRPITRAPVASCQVLSATRHARYNSTTAPGAAEAGAEGVAKKVDTRKEWLEKQDDLQRDWDAKELTYEELKPMTQQPSPVCARNIPCTRSYLPYYVGQVYH